MVNIDGGLILEQRRDHILLLYAPYDEKFVGLSSVARIYHSSSS